MFVFKDFGDILLLLEGWERGHSTFARRIVKSRMSPFVPFGDRKRSSDKPLKCDLDVSHVTIAVNDARHFDSAFNRAEEDYVIADAK